MPEGPRILASQRTALDIKKELFLEKFVELGNVKYAAALVSETPKTVYAWANQDPFFADRWAKLTGERREALAVQQTAISERGQESFLSAYAALGTVDAACKASLVPRRQVYRWMSSEPEFAIAFDEARQANTDAIEAECRRRAVEGVDEPVFFQGEIVGHVKKYSDTCLLALLSAYRPEYFKNRHEHTGRDGGPMAVIHVSYDANMKPDDMP